MTPRHRRLQLTTSTSEGKASHIVLVANDFLTVYEYLGDHARVSEPMLAFVGEYHFYDQLHGVVVARRADAKKDRHARTRRHAPSRLVFLPLPGWTPQQPTPTWLTSRAAVAYAQLAGVLQRRKVCGR